MSDEIIILIELILFALVMGFLLFTGRGNKGPKAPGRRKEVCGGCGVALHASWTACRFCGWQPTLHVVFESGPMAGQKVDLTAPIVVIGSAAGSHIVLSDPAVSRRHAEFRRNGIWHDVHDLDSQNGIYINGVRRKTSPLRPGDKIRIGHSDLVYDSHGHSAAATPAVAPDKTRLLESPP